jgi:anti-sigma B factor antagonist
VKLEFSKKDEIGILKFFGRVDGTNEKELKDVFKGYLADTKYFVYDCSELEYIDSTGLGAIISNLKSANEFNGEIYIANLQEKPRMLFEITRAYRIFEVFDDVETAVEAIKKEF